MLGKLIKNEFVQRGKQTFAILVGVLLYSVVILILHTLKDNDIINNDYYNVFVGMASVVYVFIIFASAIGIILLMFLDFGKRLFKDQGYLTHTLPVKTTDIMTSRIVFDTVAILAMAIVYPLSICIASGNFDFFKELIELIHSVLTMTGSGISKTTIILDGVLAVIAMFLSAICSIWQYNAAYALGHSFSSSKRMMSVVFYIAIYTIMQVISGILLAIVSIPAVEDAIEGLLLKVDSEVMIVMIMLIITNLLTFVSTFVLIKITTNVCKTKLNLE